MKITKRIGPSHTALGDSAEYLSPCGWFAVDYDPLFAAEQKVTDPVF